MSAIGDYIHYHYNNFSGLSTPEENANQLMQRYSNSRVSLRYQESINILNEKLKQIYLSKIKSINIDKKGENEFFSLLDDLQKNALSLAAEKMVQQLSTTNLSRKDIAIAISGDINLHSTQIQNIINIFKNIINQITGSSISSNPIPVLTFEMLQGEKASSSNIKQIYREAYLKDKTTFKVDASYSRAIKSHANRINTIMASLSAIESIQRGGLKNFDPSLQSQTIKELIWSIYSSLNIIVGFISEDILADNMPNFIGEKVKEYFSSDSSVKVTTEGTEGTNVLNVKTEDVSIEVNAPKMLEGEQDGYIDIRLPGVSLKRTNVKKDNLPNRIRIKGTSLGTYLDNSNIGENLLNFYHAYADYNMAIRRNNYKTSFPAQLNKTAAPGMENMYNYFHAAFLPLALAGSLTENDFAYFIIINNEVYSAVEIIQKVSNKNDFTSVKSDLSSQQTGIKNLHNSYYQPEVDPNSNIEGRKRSEMILSQIRSLNVTMHLIMQLNKI